MDNNVISINRNNPNCWHKNIILGALLYNPRLAAKDYDMPAEEFEAWKKKIKATKTKAEAEKITIPIAAACKKYNDLNANTRLRGDYVIHIGTLSK